MQYLSCLRSDWQTWQQENQNLWTNLLPSTEAIKSTVTKGKHLVLSLLFFMGQTWPFLWSTDASNCLDSRPIQRIEIGKVNVPSLCHRACQVLYHARTKWILFLRQILWMFPWSPLSLRCKWLNGIGAISTAMMRNLCLRRSWKLRLHGLRPKHLGLRKHWSCGFRVSLKVRVATLGASFVGFECNLARDRRELL